MKKTGFALATVAAFALIAAPAYADGHEAAKADAEDTVEETVEETDLEAAAEPLEATDEEAAPREKATEFGYRMFGGSDSHVVSRIGYCATDFERDDISTIDDLVDALHGGEYEPVSFRPSSDD